MFNSNFYPTPERLLEELFALSKSKPLGKILEPSAGKGDIINYLKKVKKAAGSRGYEYSGLDIDAIEKDVNLRNLLFGAGHNVVWEDFLTYKTHKEYDCIVMNPPFDEGVKHVLKAIELAEQQIVKDCSVYAIINAETIKNPYSNERKSLLNLLDKYNAKIEFKQHAFSDSERKTDVEVALIYLSVSVRAKSENIYDRYIHVATSSNKKEASTLERGLSVDYTAQEVQQRIDEIQRYVSEYEAAVKVIKAAYKSQKEEELLLGYLATVNKKNQSSYGLSSIGSSGKTNLDTNYLEKIDKLRAMYWGFILNVGKIKEMLTAGGIEKLQKKLAMSSNLEINMVNIEMLITSLKANQKDILVDGCVALFEKVTSHHMNEYSKNIHYYNGWKTNSAFKLNAKFIYPIYDRYFNISYAVKNSYEGMSYQIKGIISDIIRMMKLFDHNVVEQFEYKGENEFANKWLRFKVFKKGTIHIWFNDKEILNKFNFICGQHFNWLPTDDEMGTKEAQDFVVKEFGFIEVPENLLAM